MSTSIATSFEVVVSGSVEFAVDTVQEVRSS